MGYYCHCQTETARNARFSNSIPGALVRGVPVSLLITEDLTAVPEDPLKENQDLYDVKIVVKNSGGEETGQGYLSIDVISPTVALNKTLP
jgi:hypothetical protein